MKNAVFWDVMPCGSCKKRHLEERIASIIRVKRIVKLQRILAVTSNRITQPSAAGRIRQIERIQRLH
jgi:hypothetical protein